VNSGDDLRARRLLDAGAFQDADVAAAYRHRPPYPDALVRALAGAVVGSPRRVLDLGCGPGDISRPLSSYVDHIDAVDISREMLEAGRSASGGDSAKIIWHQSTAEDFEIRGRYGLVVAAESLHWMDLPLLLPRLAAGLEQGATLAFVSREERAPWDEAFYKVIPEYSMSASYAPRDLVAEIEAAGLGARAGALTFGLSFSRSPSTTTSIFSTRAAPLHCIAWMRRAPPSSTGWCRRSSSPTRTTAW
jgi:SAM-dependent methyltransferase